MFSIHLKLSIHFQNLKLYHHFRINERTRVPVFLTNFLSLYFYTHASPMRNECLGVTISVKSWIMSPCILVCLCMKLFVKFASQQLRIQFSKFQSKALSSLRRWIYLCLSNLWNSGLTFSINLMSVSYSILNWIRQSVSVPRSAIQEWTWPYNAPCHSRCGTLNNERWPLENRILKVSLALCGVFITGFLRGMYNNN